MRSSKVLVVSEKSAVHESVSRVLPERDYIPIYASGSADGLALIPAENPDLLIVGLTNPDAYQSESFHRLRKSSLERSLPLLVLYPTADEADTSADYGDAWITMPIRKSELLSLLNTLLKWRQGALQLKATERKFNEIVNSVEEMIFILDSNGRITQTNDYFTKLTGFERETALGNTFGLFLVQDDIQLFEKNIRESLQGNATKVFSGRMITAKNKVALLEISVTPVNSGDGTVEGLLCTAKDISLVETVIPVPSLPKHEYETLQVLDDISRQFMQFKGPKHEFPPLAEIAPALFQKFKRRYEAIIDMAVEEKRFLVDHRIQLHIKELAVEMGIMKCGPSDILDMHTHVVKDRLPLLKPETKKIFSTESQLLMVKLLGYIAGFYRNYAS